MRTYVRTYDGAGSLTFPGCMEESREVKKLLEAALTLESECDKLEQSLEARRKEKGTEEDKSTGTLQENHKELETKVDGLLARMTLVEDELEVIKTEFRSTTEKHDVVLKKENEDLEEVHCGYVRMLTLLAARNDPGAELPTPPCTFTLDNFEERKANNEIWCSPSFYSHALGYKLCLQVYPNGHNAVQGTHISSYVAIVPGEFDDILPWPFCGEVTMQLVNQRKTNRGHMSYTVKFTGDASLEYGQRVDPKEFALPAPKSWGTHQLVAQDRLLAQGFFADTEYLKEDKLIFRIWKVNIFSTHH